MFTSPDICGNPIVPRRIGVTLPLTMRGVSCLPAVIAVLLSACSSSTETDVDLTGTYIGQYTSSLSGEAYEGALQLTQAGSHLAGTIVTNAPRSANLSGSVSGNDMVATLTFTDGCDGAATVSADVRDGGDRIVGSYTADDCLGAYTGGFEFVRQSSPAPLDNSSLDFAGDRVTVPDHTDLDLTSTWTIEAWIKPRNANGGFQHVVSKWGGCADASYTVEVNAGRLRSGIASCTAGTQVLESSGTLANNLWQHVAVTLENGVLRMYINGALDATLPGSIAPLNTATPVWFGEQSGGGLAFDGLIAEVRFWNIARTEAQLASGMSTRLSGSESGLVGYWRFDEGSGDTAADATGRGHVGQLGNAVGPDASDPTWSTDAPPIQ